MTGQLPRCPGFHCAMPVEKSMKTHWTGDFMRSRLPARCVARPCLFMKKIGLLTIPPRHWMPASTPSSKGKIVAVKGIGGYHLLCDAQNEQAVRHLRKHKPRPDKPLAVMFPERGDDGLEFAPQLC